MKPVIVWHGHHEAPSPLEFLSESFRDRLDTINAVKAKQETEEQITRRKKLFKRFKGTLEILPRSVQRLYEKFGSKGWFFSYEIEELAAACNASRKVRALHKEQCGCGWTPENPNIFNYKP